MVWLQSIASLAVALGTFALAFVAWRQIRISQRHVDTSERSLEATERAIAATERAAEETARARIDAGTFRVIAELREPSWPPLLNSTLNSMPGGGDPTLFDSVNLHASEELSEGHVLTFPRQENELLWFRVQGLLRNEGNSTAFLELPATCRVLEEGGVYAGVPGLRQHARVTGHYRPRHALEPRECMAIEWASGRPLADWAEAYEDPNPQMLKVHFSWN